MFVIWFALDLIGLNIDCQLCQLRFAWGSFGYLKPRLCRPGARAAAKQCAIFFLVRDEPESLRLELKRIESLDTRMQTVEKTVRGMHNKIETLEHRLEGQIETGFTQMRELVAGRTHRRRSSRNGRISPVEMRTDSSNHSKEVSHSEMTSAESRRPSKRKDGSDLSRWISECQQWKRQIGCMLSNMETLIETGFKQTTELMMAGIQVN